MKRTDEELGQIAQYLSNKLDESQKAEFEHKMGNDQQLANDIEEARLLKKITERQLLREQIQRIQTSKLEKWNAEADNTIAFVPKQNSKWRTTGWSVAASIAIAVGYLSMAEVSYDFTTPTSERSDIIVNQDITIEKISKGIQFLQNNNPSKAIVMFDEVEATEGIRQYYIDAALWYETVALLKANRRFEAKALLSAIESNPDFQFEIPTLDKCKIKWRLLF